MGGFSGIPTAEKLRPSNYAGVEARARGDAVRAEIHENRPVKHRDEHAVRMATVNLEGWETEKEKRVQKAFNRIVEHEWYDKFEGNLKVVEQIHVNAVREHFAMRRDKLKTPDVKCRKGGNAIGREDWARNVEAINYLAGSTNIGTHFRGLVGQQRKRRLDQMRAAAEAPLVSPAAARAAAAAAQQASYRRAPDDDVQTVSDDSESSERGPFA